MRVDCGKRKHLSQRPLLPGRRVLADAMMYYRNFPTEERINPYIKAENPPKSSKFNSSTVSAFSIIIVSQNPFQTISLTMCNGHPKEHRCAHTSMTWHYCPSARLDLQTGIVSPCGRNQIAATQSSKAACPLHYCNFDSKNGSWLCCQCHQGPNTRGWCTQRLTSQQVGIESHAIGELQMTCDHGCCDRCTQFGMSHSRV